jgi:hypothetical protein
MIMNLDRHHSWNGHGGKKENSISLLEIEPQPIL